MSSYPIDTTIPAASNNPADDQPKMLTNFGNINSVIAVDHLIPSDSQGGYHKWARIKIGAIPGGLSSNLGTIYTKAVTTSAPVTSNELFYTPGTSGKEYQLTQTDSVNYASFGTDAATGDAGWTFLPGGLLLQYGSISTGNLNTTVTFPIPYVDNTRVYSVVMTPQDNTATLRVSVRGIVAGNGTSFIASINDNTTIARINWMSIGIPR